MLLISFLIKKHSSVGALSASEGGHKVNHVSPATIRPREIGARTPLDEVLREVIQDQRGCPEPVKTADFCVMSNI